MQPLLSIVIANYNYGCFLEDAIRSVVEQGCFRECELIIIDGGYTDNSVEIIKKYADKLSYWVSESDKGQSDAFNKGFARANGKFLTWLNADDIFLPQGLQRVCEAIKNRPSSDWFAAGGVRFSQKGTVILCTRVRQLRDCRAMAGDIQVYGPSSFFSKRLYESTGGYVSTEFNYGMDIELWNRFYHKAHRRYRTIPGYVWGFRVHERSKTTGGDLADKSKINSNSVAWEQVKYEFALLRKLYALNPLTRIGRLLSVSPVAQTLSIIDTLRFRGKDIKEVFTKE